MWLRFCFRGRGLWFYQSWMAWCWTMLLEASCSKEKGLTSIIMCSRFLALELCQSGVLYSYQSTQVSLHIQKIPFIDYFLLLLPIVIVTSFASSSSIIFGLFWDERNIYFFIIILIVYPFTDIIIIIIFSLLSSYSVSIIHQWSLLTVLPFQQGP